MFMNIFSKPKLNFNFILYHFISSDFVQFLSRPTPQLLIRFFYFSDKSHLPNLPRRRLLFLQRNGGMILSRNGIFVCLLKTVLSWADVVKLCFL